MIFFWTKITGEYSRKLVPDLQEAISCCFDAPSAMLNMPLLDRRKKPNNDNRQHRLWQPKIPKGSAFESEKQRKSMCLNGSLSFKPFNKHW